MKSEYEAESSANSPETLEAGTMKASAEVHDLIGQMLLERPSFRENLKSAWSRLANKINANFAIDEATSRPVGQVTPGRVEDLYRGEARRIDADELIAIRRAAGGAKQIAAEPQVIEARNEFRELSARIARLEVALSLADEDFHGPFRDALRQMAGGVDRSLD